jgi:hypothetical protein
MPTKLTIQSFMDRSQKVHNNFYDYSLVDYKNTKTKVTIICPKHGEFEQAPGDHMNGRGCKSCQYEKLKSTHAKSLTQFVEEANEVHEGKYSYKNSIYTNNKIQVKITCPVHGDFQQRPNNHLNGEGCPTCKAENVCTTWRYSDWKTAGEKSKNFESYKLYILRCFNDTEEFIKVGKTFTSIKYRFKATRCMPYEYEVLKIVEGEAKQISALEHHIHRKYKEYKVKPSIYFTGNNECFNVSILDNIKENLQYDNTRN